MTNTSKIILTVVAGVLLLVGIRALFHKHQPAPMPITPPVAAVAPATVASSSTVPLMQDSGVLFAQYKYKSKAYEIFPTVAAGTQKALGAFNYTKTDLGNNEYQFTLVNNAEGYKGQSVVISGDQSVYFIEPSTGDDTKSEDSITTDDMLVAVNAQGYMLK